MSIVKRFMERSAGNRPKFGIGDAVLVTSGQYLVNRQCIVFDVTYNYFKNYFIYKCHPFDKYPHENTEDKEIFEESLQLIHSSHLENKFPKLTIGQTVFSPDWNTFGEIVAVKNYDHGTWYYYVRINGELIGYPEDSLQSKMPSEIETSGEAPIV